MKFMMNGALTIGTLDGANVEMHQQLGDENIFLFGLTADQVEERRRQGYRSLDYYQQDPVLKRVLDQISAGFSDEQGLHRPDQPPALRRRGRIADEYMLLADFDSYCQAHRRSLEVYKDPESLGSEISHQHRPVRHLRRRPLHPGLRPGHLACPHPVRLTLSKPPQTGLRRLFSVRLSAGWNAVPLPEMVGRDFQENHLQNVNKCNKIEGEAD